jgi:LDH2 family malate/lactate/ureidoglycolate dehydrogenase
MPYVPEARLKEIVRLTVLAMGGSESAAADMVASLLSANMEGMDSHGVLRLPLYVNMVEKGLIDPKAEPELIRQDRAVALFDGHWCFGQVGARVATRKAIELAREHGIAAAGLGQVLHVGRLKDYVQLVALQNMIGIAFCSAGPAGGSVAPHWGGKPRFGTNPLALSVPRSGSEPLIADFATSVMAEGKLRLAVNTNHPVPDGTIIDAQGQPTNDANDFYAGGALLPFAGHKGYCLSLFIDILGGLLVGVGAASLITTPPGNGLVIMALDVAAMRPADSFMETLEELLGVVKSTPSAPGQPAVLLPGEPEQIARAQRSQTGIPVDDEAWAAIKTAGAKIGVSPAIFDLP